MVGLDTPSAKESERSSNTTKIETAYTVMPHRVDALSERSSNTTKIETTHTLN